VSRYRLWSWPPRPPVHEAFLPIEIQPLPRGGSSQLASWQPARQPSFSEPQNLHPPALSAGKNEGK